MRASALDIYRELERKLEQGEIAPAYTLCGDEHQLVERATRLVVERVVPEEERDWNYDKVSAAEVEAQDLVSSAMTYPMFGERRVLVVTDFDRTPAEQVEAWDRYLRNPAASTVVVFPLPGVRLIGENKRGEKATLAMLRRATKVVQFPSLYDQEATALVVEEIGRRGKRIPWEAAQLLVAQAGTSLHVLENEIEKLLLAAGEREEITAEDVEDVVVGQRGFSLYQLRDALGQQDLVGSLAILRRLLELGTAPEAILNAIAQHVLNMAEVAGLVRRGASDEEIAASLGLGRNQAWIGRKYRSFTRAYLRPDESRLERAIEAVGKADLALKMSYQDKRRILELLVYSLTKDAPTEVLEVPEYES